jgi:hypothetical protein
MEKTLCCACGLVLLVTSGAAQAAAVWEIKDAGLQDAANLVDEGGSPTGAAGVINSRSDLPGDPGTHFNITLTKAGGGWADIVIGDGYDLPTAHAGLAAATGNGGDLSAYDVYTMKIHNPSADKAFLAALFMNTGWTGSPYGEPNRYYQDGNGAMTWVGADSTVTLTLDFASAALWNGSGYTTGSTMLNLNHVTNIGLKIGSNLGNSGEMVSGEAFDVDIESAGGLLGDFNDDGLIDAADYTVWRDNLGGGPILNDPTPGSVDESDYTYWKEHFGWGSQGPGAGSILTSGTAVPEPLSVLLLACAAAGQLVHLRRQLA